MLIFFNGTFLGFIIFNSYERDVFTDAVLNQLDIFGPMIALLVVNELAAMRTLLATVTTTTHITHAQGPRAH